MNIVVLVKLVPDLVEELSVDASGALSTIGMWLWQNELYFGRYIRLDMPTGARFSLASNRLAAIVRRRRLPYGRVALRPDPPATTPASNLLKGFSSALMKSAASPPSSHAASGGAC